VLGVWGRLPREASLRWSSPEQEVSVCQERGGGLTAEGTAGAGIGGEGEQASWSQLTRDEASGQVRQEETIIPVLALGGD